MVEDTLQQSLETRGFAVAERVFREPDLRLLRAEADLMAQQGRTRGGTRHLLQRSALFQRIATGGPMLRLANALIGPGARATKLTLFNKKPEANWKIRWHQDVTITVKERRPVAGFEAWSEKEGVLHVRPPVAILEGLIALRLHLDPTPQANGALRVIPGSHRRGRLSRADIRHCREESSQVICEVAAGGVMAMRPLLLHASSAARAPSNRRVLHFEYASRALPGELRWA